MIKHRYRVFRDEDGRDWIRDFISKKWVRYGLFKGKLVFLPRGRKQVYELQQQSYRFESPR